MGREVLPKGQLRKLTDLSRYVAEVANVGQWLHAPYVGNAAFAHKGGMHVSAIRRHTKTYEHVEPETVGNLRRVLISDLSGRSNILSKIQETGLKFKAHDPTPKRSSMRSRSLSTRDSSSRGRTPRSNCWPAARWGNTSRFSN